MREVFSHQDLTLVSYYQGLLDADGILSFIRNENGGNPEVAGASFLPTLCVLTSTDYEAAIMLLGKQSRLPAASLVDWVCPACSESNPGNFELCWHCGALAPGQSPA